MLRRSAEVLERRVVVIRVILERYGPDAVNAVGGSVGGAVDA